MRKLTIIAILVTVAAIELCEPPKAAVAQSDAQKAFDKLKTLAGSWDGVLSGTGTPFDGKTMHFTLRVTSTGNALLHEMTGLPGRPDDPITMFYLDEDRLLLTHYCDAGNRPRMMGKVSPDGKTLEFDLLDVAGSMQKGHMHHVVFTLIDADHHTEDWTFMMPGRNPTPAHFDLRRTN
ncbi:MAG TPA: hypothetical protein VGP81_04930 [Pyrinomonadaceae bacterium]|nr:hypothetical protein [Pyrinomonadaceae bacterium]